ncbi:hypothetical protein ATANTOWER_015413, partial [Ataeniobius toweri]|nr:hypothetical protein [Ataeniobius toweri]
CESGWSGNRCHVKEKPSLTTLHPTLEATQLDPVYAGIGIGLVLLLAGVAVCFLALCKNKCGFIKADPMKYGMMDNPSFDWRAELPSEDKSPGGRPSINPKGSDGPGFFISVYPWRREVEQGSNWKDAKQSFSNPLYNYPSDTNGAVNRNSEE